MLAGLEFLQGLESGKRWTVGFYQHNVTFFTHSLLHDSPHFFFSPHLSFDGVFLLGYPSLDFSRRLSGNSSVGIIFYLDGNVCLREAPSAVSNRCSHLMVKQQEFVPINRTVSHVQSAKWSCMRYENGTIKVLMISCGGDSHDDENAVLEDIL